MTSRLSSAATGGAGDRHAGHAIDPAFLERWSSRAFEPVGIEAATLLGLFEAARWAPSCFNSQPWRFLWARRDTPNWAGFLDLLAPANQGWAQHASALVALVSKTTMRPPGSSEDTPAPDHSFDAGAAWGHLALQASLSGWVAHAMAGFDRARAAATLAVPAAFHVETMIAIGRRGDPARLDERLRAREAPNGRVPLEEIAWEGPFPAA